MTPELPFDPEVKELTLHGAPVTYTDDGLDEPAFIFIHGLPGSGRDFRWLGAALRDANPQARVVRLDMPGFGGTDVRLGGEQSLDTRARFVGDALAGLELDEVILLGHSMGGAVAMGGAAVAGERVRGLVLLASVGLTPHRGFRALPHPRIIAPLVCSPPGRLLLAGQVRKAFIRLGFSSSTPTEELFTTLRAVATVRFPTIRRFARAIADRGVRALVCLAKDDPLIEHPIAENLARELRASLTVFEDGGHNIQKTHAVEIAEALIELRATLRSTT